MSELTNKELDAIRARLQTVTPGPWVIRQEGGDITAIDSLDDQTVLAGAWNSATDNLHPLEVEPADAEFIAHAPTDVARLVAEVERLQAENERLAKRAECFNERFQAACNREDDKFLEILHLQAENAALRARAVPNYSEQCPTKPGGYWMCKGGGGTPVLIELLHCSGELHVCHTDGMFYPLWKQFNDGWRFAGPIPEPKGGGDE